jgi:hypothetical protein
MDSKEPLYRSQPAGITPQLLTAIQAALDFCESTCAPLPRSEQILAIRAFLEKEKIVTVRQEHLRAGENAQKLVKSDEDGIATQCIREAADEIERLRSQPCPYVVGRTTLHCSLTPFTLTDAELEAVRWFSEYGDLQSEARRAEVLKGLLGRLG